MLIWCVDQKSKKLTRSAIITCLLFSPLFGPLAVGFICIKICVNRSVYFNPLELQFQYLLNGFVYPSNISKFMNRIIKQIVHTLALKK